MEVECLWYLDLRQAASKFVTGTVVKVDEGFSIFSGVLKKKSS
jgi:hypothetical protein